MRVKKGFTTNRRHKKMMRQTKGMTHSHRRSFRLAKQTVTRALQFGYRDRRNKKRDLRSLWITRINAAARENGTTYAKLIANMKAKKIELDRKVLADIAVNEPKSFSEVVKAAK